MNTSYKETPDTDGNIVATWIDNEGNCHRVTHMKKQHTIVIKQIDDKEHDIEFIINLLDVIERDGMKGAVRHFSMSNNYWVHNDKVKEVEILMTVSDEFLEAWKQKELEELLSFDFHCNVEVMHMLFDVSIYENEVIDERDSLIDALVHLTKELKNRE